MRFRTSLSVGLLLAIVILAVLASSPSTATNQEKPIYKSTGGEGTIAGTIAFVGKPPKPVRIDTSSDAVCEKVNPNLTTDWVIVTDDKLANVVVYVRGESLNLYSFEAPSADVILEHTGCRYVPHVLGLQTQQTLKVLNSDLTSHNTHLMTKNNRVWNQSQPPGATPLEQRFAVPELFIPIRDNQHPWEKAYVNVFSHPFFAVSATDGTYKISGVPPGQYAVVAWHERLGEQTVDIFLTGSEIFVAGRAQKTLDFSFKASEH